MEMPKFSASASVKTDNTIRSWTFEGPVPEKIMDAYKMVVGDGLAKVSVSADFSLKEYGAGVSSMASVSLTCGQDEASIRQAAVLAGELARDFAQEHAAAAHSELKSLKENLKG